ncbi:MAG: branched-chain amino acid aminotransferase [Flavobacteriales bacterium]
MNETARGTSIKTTPIKKSRISEVDFSNLPFGREFSDHMFVADYKDGKWSNMEIRPFENFSLSPSISALHYGQSIFEGLKAYKNEKGEVFVFRADMNAKRLNRSAERMCMPKVPENVFLDALYELLKLDSQWVPSEEGSSLYIRPFMFATDHYVGIKPSETYRLCIFTCPVGKYYSEPVKIKIEDKYSRAMPGGTGTAKSAGNYGGALYPAKMAQDKGFHQMLWTDSVEHKYIEECGTMNIVFKINGKLVTPALSGTILDGITRNTVLHLAKEWGTPVEERKITVDEVLTACKNSTLTEAFGLGTAATVANIKMIGIGEEKFELPAFETREFSNKISQYLLDYRKGRHGDPYGWLMKVD